MPLCGVPPTTTAFFPDGLSRSGCTVFCESWAWPLERPRTHRLRGSLSDRMAPLPDRRGPKRTLSRQAPSRSSCAIRLSRSSHYPRGVLGPGNLDAGILPPGRPIRKIQRARRFQQTRACAEAQAQARFGLAITHSPARLLFQPVAVAVAVDC